MNDDLERFREKMRELHAHIDAVAAEDRRHFEVLVERMHSKLKLARERVTMVGEKVDRLGADVHAEFEKIDRRLVRVAAAARRRRRP